MTTNKRIAAMPRAIAVVLAGMATLAAALTGAAATADEPAAKEPVRIAYIDPLSGPFAGTGEAGLIEFRFAAETLVNAKGGVLGGRTLEIVPLDNKLSPKQSLIQLQVAIDRGIRFIAQGQGSSVAHALIAAIDKHNRRNPESRVLFLNYAAADPALTGAACSFWHFRWDANADIKMDALTEVIARDTDLKRVYLIGQDYSFGKAVAAAARRMLAEKRPDIEIVGDELHPIGKVKDFTPYARKIMAADADAIITANWGADMVGLGRAVVAAGFDGPIFTYYAAGNGITRVFGPSGKNRIRVITDTAMNPASDRLAAYIRAFKDRHPGRDITLGRVTNVVEMLAIAIDKAGTTDPASVATALEGMEFASLWGNRLIMRAADHQVIQDVHVLVHTDEGVVFDYDGSGFGLVKESTVGMASAGRPVECDMARP